MATEQSFQNLPNFRQAGGRNLINAHGQRVRDGLLFRSSRTDFLSKEEIDHFQQLGIRSIIDLRRQEEYERAEGEKLLDGVYDPHVVKKGQSCEMKPSFRWGAKGVRKRNCAGSDETDSAPKPRGKRYLVNLMTMDLVWHLFCQVNFFLRYLSLVLVLFDWIFGCHAFVRLFNWLVVNRMSLSEQYVNLLEFGKPAVADTLRLITEDESVPVLIHCAHGKDRTGLIIAVILGCLDVDDEIIVEDYALSESGLAPIKERVLQETVKRYGFNKEFLRAEANTMRTVLQELKTRYGSISQYLESAGFTAEEQERLKEVFLEPKEPN